MKKKKKKILFLGTDYLTDSGWGSVAFYISKYLEKKSTLIRYDYEKLGINFSLNYLFRLDKGFRAYFKLRSELKNVEYIVSSAELFLPLLFFIKLFNPKIKIVFIGYGTYAYTPFKKYPLISHYSRFLLKSVDYFLVSSNFSIKKVKEFYSKELILLPLGVDLERYYKINDFKKENAFVFVGHQKSRKGVDYLIKAFKKLVDEFNDVKLYFVGPINENYQTLVNDLNLQKNIIFVGRASHEDLLDYYNKSLCHILPSLNSKYSFEGFGLVHLEANACGIPSIGSSNSANDDVIINGKTGYLCNQADVNDIYDKMREILINKKNYENLCKNSLNHAKNFTWNKTADIILEVIK